MIEAGLKGVAPADVERVCAALSAHPRLGKATKREIQKAMMAGA